MFSFEKLGWFRLSADGSTFIQGGEILMEKIHRAKVENCVEQKYNSILDANYYINGDANVSYLEGTKIVINVQHLVNYFTSPNPWSKLKLV